MKKLIILTVALAFAQQSVARELPPPERPVEMAERDTVAFEIVEQLTRTVGARMAGTDAEQKARDWAVKKLNDLGFANVREETYTMLTWVRGQEYGWAWDGSNRVWAPLSITALGNSGTTGTGRLRGQIAYFETFDDLVDANPAMVKGKIVFIDHKMTRTQDGSSYGYFGRARRQGPNIAAKKGAVAIIVRSAGTADHDHPHTGNTNFDEGVTPIPAAAISNADAKFLGQWTQIELVLTPKNLGQQKSGNVIAEIVGSQPSLPPILIACHLDSWDLAKGAIDDASGCGIITAAAHNFHNNGWTPKRTIRILWAGAEEVGGFGGKAYGEKYASQPHALAMESDFGADRVWAVDFTLPDSAKALKDRITRRLALLGITPRNDPAHGGTDIGPIIAKQGLGVIDLQQDGTRYFDIHHNATDTIAVIDKDQLRQNVVAWTIVLEEVANYSGELRPEKKP